MNTLTPLPHDAPQVIQAVSGKGNKELTQRDLQRLHHVMIYESQEVREQAMKSGGCQAEG
jgi:hypothetical protein